MLSLGRHPRGQLVRRCGCQPDKKILLHSRYFLVMCRGQQGSRPESLPWVIVRALRILELVGGRE